MAISAEQQARDMLERLGHPNAQSMTAGDLVELANLINECQRLRLEVVGKGQTIEAILYVASEKD